RIRNPRNYVRIIIQLQLIGRLSIKRADAKYAIITRAFQAVADQGRKYLSNARRGPVKEYAYIPLVGNRTIQAIVAIQRQPVLARLQVLEPKGDLTLPEPEAELVFLIHAYIYVSIAQLPEILP